MKKWLAIDPWLTSIAGYFEGMSREVKRLPSEVVLVQCVEDAYYFGLFGQIASSLREKGSVRIEQFVLRSLSVGEFRSWRTFLLSRLLVNPLFNAKWVRLYYSFCDGVGYRSTTLHPIADCIDFFRAWKRWRNLNDKESLIAMRIGGVTVGDLINDSFLRFKPAPTVDLKDRYLLILLWQAYRDVRRARAYFSRVRPKLYLTSYSTYIQHGIPVRVALQHGVRVFSFGNYQEFAKEISNEDWVHTKNPDGYANGFSTLDHQDEKLALAEAALATRLSGGVDSATAYMKKSAYAESGDPVPDVRGAVVIFLHDFYDSPHVYREMVFPDFWEWVCFTIEALKAANIPFFVKPHPNQIGLSSNVLNDLQHRYPGLVMISSGITNKQLVEAGMSCAVTVYGTVAHEVAYLGVPTIACAHHPHVSFGFCRTAHTRAEYGDLLRQSATLQLAPASMRRESLMFYYMHNLSLSDEMMALRAAVTEFRMACEKNHGAQELIERLKMLSRLSGYQASLARMSFTS